MSKSITIILLIANLMFIVHGAIGQATSCSTAEPVCLNLTNTYHMNTNNIGESGPNYGCLYTYPNPAWYYIKILNPGNITIRIEGKDGTITRDVDFICWGPFNSLNNICTDSLIGACYWAGGPGSPHCPNNTTNPTFYPTFSAPNIIDCSYDARPDEICRIPSAQTGKYYMLCITNYSCQQGNITFTQTSGNGSSDCSFLNINEETADINSFAIFPNPNDGKFTITFNAKMPSTYNIAITNAIGQIVYQETVTEFVGTYTKQINLLEYGKGLYSVKISDDKHVSFRKVIIY